MGRVALFFAITAAFTGLSSGAGLLLEDSVNASVGGSVTFTTSQTPQTPLYHIKWEFGSEDIVTAVIGTVVPEAGYRDRISLSTSTGSLELRNLAETDTGVYRVYIRPTEAEVESITGNTTLKVYAPVSDVRLTANDTDLVEFNDTVSLSCSASGSRPLSFLWFKDGVEVKATDRVNFTDGGATLTISPALRVDHASYTCNVSNPVSSDVTSNKEILSVSYGPEDVVLIPPPSDEYWEDTAVPLSCSADSRPPAQFKWFRNGEMLSETGAQIDLVLKQSGNYSCQAFNTKTLRYTMAQPASITVLKKITGIFIKSSSNPPVEGMPLNLTCDASGSIFTREWMINGTDLQLSDNIGFYDEKRVVSFKNLTRKDNGKYTCKISNTFSSQSEDYEIFINYGKAPKTGLSPGAIAGITVASLVVVVGAAAVGVYMFKHQKQTPKSNTRTDGEGRDNSAYAQNQEVNYADVRFVKKDGAVVQLGVQNNTEYSEVQRNNNPPPAARLPTYNAHMQRSRRPAPEPPTEYAEVRPKRH